MHAARRGGHRLDERSLDRGPVEDGPFHLPSGRAEFAWANFRSRPLHPGHHRPRRHQRPRLQLRGQFQGLLLGQAVEPWEHRGKVFLRRHRGQHRRRGEAQLPFPNRLHHLGEPLDEPGGGAPVMSRRAGELQPLVEIREEVRVTEGAEELAFVELGQGPEEGAQGGELDAEEIGEPGVEGAGLEEVVVVHEWECLTRIPDLLERARCPAVAFARRGISKPARIPARAATGRWGDARGRIAGTASRRSDLTKTLSSQRFLTPQVALGPSNDYTSAADGRHPPPQD